ncbi:MAG: HD domain-containing phosphohydrolase [Anaerolineaceae bacterium]
MVAKRAAIAIENGQLLENLEQTNLELLQAYDVTIEGWSRAMDLRDKETEGHTLRVTQMAIKLARLASIQENEIQYVRWGALLHDIGKLGVPDSILLKPGTLSDEEWMIMKQHPVYAFQMLSPIKYLQLATDIPYCHHERWDGSGYPRGLSGDTIPLAARLFSVIDVWDALTSNRPYRPAWSKERALEYIEMNSGIQFDPFAVNLFFQLDNLNPII